MIEMVVVAGIIALLMVIMSEIMIGSFRLRTKMKFLDILQKNAFFVQSEIRKNVYESFGDSIACGVDSYSSINLISSMDGIGTTIACEASKIASRSAEREVILTDTSDVSGIGISIAGCNNFVKCTEIGARKQVEFNYILKVGSVGNGMSLPFSFKLTTRN